MDFGPTVYPGSWPGLAGVRGWIRGWVLGCGSEVRGFIGPWMGSRVRGFVGGFVGSWIGSCAFGFVWVSLDPKLVKIGAILATFWSVENFGRLDIWCA